MYALTANDRLPVTLFGKTYMWYVTDEGTLSLVSARQIEETAEALKAALNG